MWWERASGLQSRDLPFTALWVHVTRLQLPHLYASANVYGSYHPRGSYGSGGVEPFEIIFTFLSIRDHDLPDLPLALWGNMGSVFNQTQLVENSRRRAIGDRGCLGPSLTPWMQSLFWVT